MRGAAATGEHGPGSVICSVSEEGLLSVSTVRTMMDDVFVRSLRPSGRRRSGMAASHGVSDPAATGATTDTLLRQPSDDRALLAVLLLRERAKEHSPLAPYIRSFLHLPAGVPSGWDPATEEGAARRAELQFSNPKALLMADLLREQIATTYLALVPAAIEATLGSGSPLGGEARTAGGGVADGLREHLTDMYSLDRFRQAWLAIASRDFTNTLQAASPTPLDDGHPFPATFLVPIVDLMNHGGGASNVDVRFDRRRGGFVLTATKSIRRGEELRFSYGKLCAEQALLTYGFADDDMVACPPPGRQ